MFWQNQKLHYLCIVDVGNTTENKDVSTPIQQSDHQESGELIRVDYLKSLWRNNLGKTPS
jgi:hypothetical protein